MQNHTKVFFEFYGYNQGDFIQCQVCGKQSVDIHHIIPRSKFGSKRKDEQDAINNLIALCRTCHDQAHAELLTKDMLKARVELYMKLNNPDH